MDENPLSIAARQIPSDPRRQALFWQSALNQISRNLPMILLTQS
jgi:hypothetical protein